MFYNLEQKFGADGKKLYEDMIENAKEDIPKTIEENIVVLRAMKKADLPQYMLRRVVYDNCSIYPESLGRQFKRCYITERLKEQAEKLDDISKSYREILWTIAPSYSDFSNNQTKLREIIEDKIRSSINVKFFTDNVYATLRPIIDKALDEI
jgi:hypothetical protein